jgi:alpha-glucosidase
MLWDDGPNGGFCPAGVEPWLPMEPGSERCSVAAQREDSASMLALTGDLLALRRREPALHRGTFSALDGVPPGCFAYLRSHPGSGTFLVALNYTEERIDLPGVGSGRISLAANRERTGERVGRSLSLDPEDAVVVRRD